MIRWRETRLDDFRQVRHIHEDVRDSIDIGLATEPHRYAALCPRAATMADGEDPIAMVGLETMWKGVSQAWAIVGEGGRRHPVALTRGTMKLLGSMEIRAEVYRTQATARADDAKACRWLEFLGFRTEGVMENYGPGGFHTHVLFARVRKHE